MEMEACPQLLSLIANDCEMVENRKEGRSYGCSEEKKLELRLGLPGQDWSCKHAPTYTRDESSSLLALPYISSVSSFHDNNYGSYAQKSPSNFHGKTHNNEHRHIKPPPFLHSPPTIPTEIAQTQAFSPSANNGSQKRTAPPVVGWPPIRSSRRILASTSSPKTSPEVSANERNELKGLFVKINMDGVPIGRKVDLNAYDSYENLSSAVDQLFKGLLAAQKDSSGGRIEKNEEDTSIKNVMDGSGEYTLVYEDNEGDRMLVGDVPWNMFVSAAKRLRVLKSSELPARTLGIKKRGKSLCEKIPIQQFSILVKKP